MAASEQSLMDQPDVTVIATAYNTSVFISDTILSVVNQTFSRFELIIVDDCSTDATHEIASKMAVEDERIFVYRHTENLGAGEARNLGLKHARGRYIAFIDTDDIWEDQFLEEMVNCIRDQTDGCAGVFCSTRIINEEGELTGFEFNPGRGAYDLLRMLEGINPTINGSTLLIKKECFDEVGGFLSMPLGQDIEMWLRILAKSSRSFLQHLPRHLVRYRDRRSSLSKRSHVARQESFEHTIKNYLPLIPFFQRGKVYSAFVLGTDFAGPGLNPWRKTMGRKALLYGGLLFTKQKRRLLSIALRGLPPE